VRDNVMQTRGAVSHAIDGQVGLISITGDIALYQGKPVVHDLPGKWELRTSQLATMMFSAHM
jgi:hypothetical protein